MNIPLVFPPHPLLRPFIDTYIYIQMDSHIHDVNPTGNKQFFFVLNQNGKTLRATKNQPTFKRFFFASPDSQYERMITDEIWSCIGVIFKPFGAYQILGIPQEELVSLYANLEEIVPLKFRYIQDKLDQYSNSIPQLVTILEKWLLELLDHHQQKNNIARIEMATNIIFDNNGTASIKDLCSQLYVSKRTLELEFKQKIGISPKMLSRIARFNSVQKMLHTRKQIDFQKLCIDFHYYDQAHFIKEFKYFSGYSPSKYFLSSGNMGDAIFK